MMTYAIKTLKGFIKFQFLLIFIAIETCYGQNKPGNIQITAQTSLPQQEAKSTFFKTNSSFKIDDNIRSILQDKTGKYWFGTNGAGVYCYDGKTLNHYTTNDGLANNQVQSIQEDQSGNLWFGTGLFGVSRFDGKKFTSFTTKENLQLSNGSDKQWKIEPNDLWFFAGGGVYNYNGNVFEYLPLNTAGFETKHSQNSPFQLSRFAVYSILKDTKGNVWFGTQSQGVCRYDGKSFTWFTEKGLAGPAVLCIFEDTNGNIWIGNNGGGLFRYDGKSLVNFTEEKGLGNEEFRRSGKSGPGTLARIYSMNEDRNGALWVGTVDAGVWRYDKSNLTNYTTRDGLSSNAVNTIYKDRNGELWFGTDENGICKFNGKTFTKYEIK